jgi:hypothetical protein
MLRGSPRCAQRQQQPTLPGGIRVGPPAQKELLTQTGVFVALSAWTLAQVQTVPSFGPLGLPAGWLPDPLPASLSESTRSCCMVRRYAGLVTQAAVQ